MIPKADPVKTPAQYGAVAPDGREWPLNASDPDIYGVVRIYPTIQGEGGMAGTPMTIVRLKGCPISCSFCDTPESWALPEEDDLMGSEEIAEAVDGYPPRWALVTGGEPTWYRLDDLTSNLRERGIKRALETSGTYPITGAWNYITVSPKPKGLRPLLPSFLSMADEIKWIVGRAADVTGLEDFLKQYEGHLYLDGAEPPTRVSVQPMSASPKATALCLDALMKHPDWRLSTQLHRLWGIA